MILFVRYVPSSSFLISSFLVVFYEARHINRLGFKAFEYLLSAYIFFSVLIQSFNHIHLSKIQAIIKLQHN